MAELRSSHDNFRFGAFRADARGERRGGVVVIQEIFGVTDHIRERSELYAANGYDVIAPSLFDRIEPGFQATLDAAGSLKGRAAYQASPWEQVTADVQAAIDALAPPVFVTGFCWGGVVTWLAAARCRGVKKASAFYGRMINELLDDAPKVPIILHYGEKDASIPASNIDAVRARYPKVPIYTYDAGHGFCREGSDDFHAESCRIATERTLSFFSS